MSSPPSLSQSEVSIICVNQSECIKCGGERAVKIGNFEGRHSLGRLDMEQSNLEMSWFIIEDNYNMIN